MIRLGQKQYKLLLLLAEYRLLLNKQIALINSVCTRTVERKIHGLIEHDYITQIGRKTNGTKGKSGAISLLNEKGVIALKSKNLIDQNIPIDRFVTNKVYNVEHELLLNWFRIHLRLITETQVDITSDFISSTTPFLLLNNNGLPFISESFKNGRSKIDFVPDGVFTIRSKEQNKCILFFLEVDMSTESLDSKRFKPNSIVAKVKNYQAYFESIGYKRYEESWNTKFIGFRLLFLTNSTTRKQNISNLVSAEKSNDFIWIADQYDMFQKGLGGKIWARGGQLSNPQQSIIGPSLAFDFKETYK